MYFPPSFSKLCLSLGDTSFVNIPLSPKTGDRVSLYARTDGTGNASLVVASCRNPYFLANYLFLSSILLLALSTYTSLLISLYI